MTSDGLNEILSQENALDVLLFASENSRLRVDTTSSSTIQGQFGEVHWSVTKDDEKEIRSISTRVTIGTYTYNNEVIDGGPIAISEWVMSGLRKRRRPSYSDPFVDFAVLSSQGQTENIPPFGFDTNSISNLDWRITADEESTQQVATSSNSTHSIVVELFGDPQNNLNRDLLRKKRNNSPSESGWGRMSSLASLKV